ncbi:MAG: hypothetical protein LBQ50_05970 [Planctomycetaceae bacterium]|jgi:hypothetical protein|nr:hypothetical protein [Planctomycetaceae bacterium]
MENPQIHISYEILDPTDESDRELTSDIEVANDRYARGYLVSKHELVVAYLSTTGQKLTTILTTEWRNNE